MYAYTTECSAVKSDAVLVSRSESAKVFDFKFFVTHLNKRFFCQTK